MTRVAVMCVNVLGQILRMLNYRPAIIWLPERIGHLVAEIDMVLKEQAISDSQATLLIVYSRKRLANESVMDCWKHIVRTWCWARLYEFIRRHRNQLSQWEVISLEDGRYGRACSQYTGKPFLRLSKEEHAKGQAILREMGVPDGKWYACFHNREGGFLPDLAYHAYRDAPIEALQDSFKWVVEKGGIVFRMGDPSMRALPPMEGVIDYAHSDFRTPFMDMFLCATNRFFIGCSSGLFCLAGGFGRPVGCVNMTPMGSVPFYPGDSFIPKLVREKETGRFLSFTEVLSGRPGNFWRQEEFDDHGLETVPNDAEDILQLTRQVYQAGSDTENAVLPSPLQQEFRKLLRKEHTGYTTRAVIGAAFVKKYADLF